MKIDCAYYTSAGSRSRNEDAVSCTSCAGRTLAIVADGVGGSDCGDIASSTAVRVVQSALQDAPFSVDALEDAVLLAHREICSVRRAGHSGQTTACAVWIEGSSACAATVGDSRIYQFRGGEIRFQSVDHSLAQLAVYTGEIAPSEIRSHPDRNKLIRALGSDLPPRVDSAQLELLPGDRLLLCTDGFWGSLVETEMVGLCEHCSTAETWLKAMQKIVTGTARDNHSAVAMILMNEAPAESERKNDLTERENGR